MGEVLKFPKFGTFWQKPCVLSIIDENWPWKTQGLLGYAQQSSHKNHWLCSCSRILLPNCNKNLFLTETRFLLRNIYVYIWVKWVIAFVLGLSTFERSRSHDILHTLELIASEAKNSTTLQDQMSVLHIHKRNLDIQLPTPQHWSQWSQRTVWISFKKTVCL